MVNQVYYFIGHLFCGTSSKHKSFLSLKLKECVLMTTTEATVSENSYRPHPKDGEGYIFTLCVSPHLDGGGGSQVSDFLGGSPVSDFPGGGPRSQIFWGGSQSQIFGGGSLVSDFWGGSPVSIKGKIFDTRFGLIHVQTGKKFFVEGPPPPSKGKNF